MARNDPFLPSFVNDADPFGMMGRTLRTGERQTEYKNLVRKLRKAKGAADVFDRLTARELADTFVDVARLTQAKDIVLEASRRIAFERLCRDLGLPKKVLDASGNYYGNDEARAMIGKLLKELPDRDAILNGLALAERAEEIARLDTLIDKQQRRRAALAASQRFSTTSTSLHHAATPANSNDRPREGRRSR